MAILDLELVLEFFFYLKSLNIISSCDVLYCRAIKNATNNGYVCVAAVKGHISVGGVIDRTQSVYLLTYYIIIYGNIAAYNDINRVTDSGRHLLRLLADRTLIR